MTSPDPQSEQRPDAPAPQPAPWGPPSAIPVPDSPVDRQWAAFIGRRWPTYRRKFAPFFEDARFTPTWNWPAALFAPYWFLYRKLYLPFVFFWVAPTVVYQLAWRGDSGEMPSMAIQPGMPLTDSQKMVFGSVLAVMVLAGGTANYLLFRRAHAALRVLAERGAAPEHTVPLLARVGGTNRTAVVIVLLVLGLSALMMARQQAGVAP